MVNGEKQESLDFIRGKRVGALSGIASPESFERFLGNLGAVEISRFRFLDHHRFTNAELERIFARAGELQLDLLVTTEKDAVRIDPAFQPACPFYYLRVEIHMSAGSENFEAAVRRICFPRQSSDADRWESGLTRPPFPDEETLRE